MLVWVLTLVCGTPHADLTHLGYTGHLGQTVIKENATNYSFKVECLELLKVADFPQKSVRAQFCQPRLSGIHCNQVTMKAVAGLCARSWDYLETCFLFHFETKSI